MQGRPAVGNFKQFTMYVGWHASEQIELPAKLLDYFSWSNKNNINQSQASRFQQSSLPNYQET